MLILAFDTSGFAGSLALLKGPVLLREVVLQTERRSAQTLAPAIAELLNDQGVAPGQIKLVATTIGPGSFTGLRIGVTTAKTFAYAVGAGVLGISTLEAIAHGVPPELLAGAAHEVHAVIDAQRSELFVGRFRVAELNAQSADLPPLTRSQPDQIVAADAWLANLSPQTVVTGTGLAKLEGRLPADVVAAPNESREPRAAVVGRLAWRDYESGRRDDLWKLAPLYLRPSYAEEKSARTQRGPRAS